MTPRIGSLCTGYGGLDMAVQQVLGGELAWVSDLDPGAAAILAHHHPDVPNLGDITAADWAEVARLHGPVDVVCGGYPCQPFSTAGQRKGTADARHIWPFIATALRVLRPRIAVFENVANHLRLGFDTVLADLAALGLDAEWCLVRASEVGAPHRRERLLLLAWPADAQGPRLEGARLPGRTAERGPGPAADTEDLGHERGGRARDGRPGPADGGLTVADPPRVGHGHAGPAGVGGVPAAAVAGGDSAAADTEGDRRGRIAEGGRNTVRRGLRAGADGRGEAPANADGLGWGADQLHLRARELHPVWGRYATAIARWEPIQGRRVPRATDTDRRLTPEFVEWDMGLPAGHVTNPAIWHGWRPKTARNAQLHALGNGVIPRQAAAAIRLLIDRAQVAA